MTNSFANKQVLVAENVEPIRQLIVWELESMGFDPKNIYEADNGIEAVNCLLKNKLDLIISEFSLPKMDGLTFLQKVRSLKNSTLTPFLMMTGESDTNKENQAFESGADQFIQKPFEKKIFHETISKLLIPQNQFERKKVLIVEDSPTIRNVISKNLIQTGFNEGNILVSSNGEEGIKALKTETVSLVILDWHMPVMNGFEFTQIVRNKFSKKELPILMVSNENDKGKVIQIFQKGINAYIIKPFTAIDIETKIKSIFSDSQ
jgi:CheY-like chemotaxis protein